jgi:sec1 family domain-containing protein 1
VYLNFVTRIERTLLEKLAQELVNNNCVSMVSKIYDQYLDVIALEPGLFTLNIKDSFTQYNAPSLSETQIRFVT